MATGSVTALVRVKTTAKRNSIQLKMKAKLPVAIRPGTARGKSDGTERLQPGRAIDEGTLFDLGRYRLEVGAHHPDDEGEIEDGVENDQRGVRVEPQRGVDLSQVAQQEKEGHDQHNRRHHPLGKQPEGEMTTTGAEASQAVGGQAADDHRQHGGAGGDDDAVLERKLALGGHDVAIVDECRLLGDPDGWVVQVLTRQLHRHGDDPQNREETEDEHDQQHDVARRRAHTSPGIPTGGRDGRGPNRQRPDVGGGRAHDSAPRRNRAT